MNLTSEQKQQLRQDGYIHLPGIVPPELIDRALRGINAWIGRGMSVTDMKQYSSQSYCPELSRTPVISDLVNASPVHELAEAAVGAGRLLPVTAGQVALRFPNDGADRPGPPSPHIDGMYTPTNGVPKGSIQNFTALVGIVLSDVTESYCGNFAVWPGSHERYSAYFRERGAQSLLDGLPKVDIGVGRQVTAKAGDAVICHYLLGHGGAANVSPHVRYACYFRLKTVDHDTRRWETMQDPWLDWDGMR